MSCFPHGVRDTKSRLARQSTSLAADVSIQRALDGKGRPIMHLWMALPIGRAFGVGFVNTAGRIFPSSYGKSRRAFTIRGSSKAEPTHDERAILFFRFVKRCPKAEPAHTSRHTFLSMNMNARNMSPHCSIELPMFSYVVTYGQMRRASITPPLVIEAPQN